MRTENKVIINNLNGDLKRGGYIANASIAGDTDVIIRGENVRISAKSGSGFVDPDFIEVFNGHALSDPDPVQFDRYVSSTTLQLGTWDAFLRGESLQDIGFTQQASPANPHQITDMRLADLVEHILTRHSNAVIQADVPDGVIEVLNIERAGSTNIERYNVRKSTNLWQSLQQIGGGETSGEFFRVWLNRKNEFNYQPSPMFFTTPQTSKMTIDKAFMTGRAQVKLNNNLPGQSVGQVALTAIKNNVTSFTSTFPTTPAIGKILPPKRGVYAGTQARADVLAERLYKWLTRPFTLSLQVDPGLIFLDPVLELADKVTVDYDGLVEDQITGSGISLDISGDYFIFGINVTFSANHTALARLILEIDNSA